jgi:hypothetical protein
MPGYNVLLELDKDHVKCCRCSFLLREARQHKETAERCCLSCIPSCAADDDYWPDKAIDKEVKELTVTCGNKEEGCQWKGSVETFIKVFADCIVDFYIPLFRSTAGCVIDLLRYKRKISI